MTKLIAFIFALICGSVNAQSWTPEQKTLGAMYMTAHVIDWGQTRAIAKNPQRWVEMNPLIGPHPSLGRVNTYFALAPVIGYFALDALPSEHRTLALKVLTVMEITTVGRNHYIGIRVSF